MATYNGENFIAEQLQSILSQLSRDDEVVISDDGSSDQTLDVINSLKDDRIKVFLNQGPHGFTHNFENALKHACGDYIFLSDQDDVWKPRKVAIVMEALQRVDFVITDNTTVDGDFNEIQKSRIDAFNLQLGFWRHLLKSRFLGCCMAFRRNVLEASLPFPENDFLVEHDIWLAAVAFLYFKSELIADSLIYYRRHGKNASEGGFTKGSSLKVKIQKRIYRLYHLLAIRKKVKKIMSNEK
ncbi:glycosyltransferase family 2 protein [Fibrobacter sp. UWR3]|uniref:glycosyltransferase family 2 protein n=1 Tax=Fibrobacter sp. UWR3 TaxID=1896217 RepID=UPI0009FA0A61